MIEVRTFLKWDQFFVPVEDFKGVFENLSHIEGAIELSIDQRPLLTRELWDDVDQLWALLLQCLHRLQAGEEASTYFPDQAIQITLTPEDNGQRVRFHLWISSTRQVEARAPRDTFVRAMARGARYFFEQMQLLAPQYEEELESLFQLEQTLKS